VGAVAERAEGGEARSAWKGEVSARFAVQVAVNTMLTNILDLMLSIRLPAAVREHE
jgi:hypothetical protein